jgi:putative ABC transport system ATP-binding protein
MTVQTLERQPSQTQRVRPSNGERPPLIRLEGLTKSYTEGGVSRTVLDALDREFYAGEFVCLLGKSGSGKSTLLNLLSGIDAPSRGDVVIYDAGQPVKLTALDEQARTLFRRRHIGIIFQFFNLIPTLTVLENVTLPLELNGLGRDGGCARARRCCSTGSGWATGSPPSRTS